MRSIEKSDRTQDELQQLAQDIVSTLSELDPSHSEELLGLLVSEMFRIVAERELHNVRRRRQAEGIAQAKAAGVQFGSERLPLPHGFEPMAQMWHEGGISASQAAKQLGMNRNTFLRRARERYADNR